MLHKVRLLTPGPTMIPERISQVMALPILHHRSPEFKPVFKEAQDRLRQLFQTKNDVLMLSSSGTGAMEAALVNLCRPGDTVITVNGGKFGERWSGIAKAFGLKPVVVEVPWGEAVSVSQIADAYARHPEAVGVFCQACETSTGVMHPVDEVTRWRDSKAPHVIVAVDGITGLGAFSVPMDAWNIDVLLTGSQKAVMLPPGLAMIALGKRAWDRAASVKGALPSYYFNLHKEAQAQREQTTTAWTPAISLILGLRESLRMMEEEGFENLYKRHALLARATRAAGCALGLKLLAETSPSPSITAFYVPEGIDAEKVVKHMRDVHGYTLIGGQDHLKGKIFRIGHMGYVDEYDLLGAFCALERTFRALEWKGVPAYGTATRAFLEELGDSK